MEEDFGSQLRAYRQARKMTQAGLSEQGSVSLRALAYWEAGRHTPGIQELDSIAAAMRLTPEERRTLIVLLPTGKVSKLVRALPAWADTAPPPGIGDLIRALRWRKRCSQGQMSRALGAHRSTVSRWEEGQAAPNEETRLRLCVLLDALPEERAFLLASPATPLWDGASPSLDVCREEAARLEHSSGGEADPLFDLSAHLLAGTLWNKAARQPEARPVLAQVYAAHAAFSCLRGADEAALDYSGRSLALIRQDAAPPEAVWYRALWANNHARTHRAPQIGPEQSLRQVKKWLLKVRTPDTRACLLLSAAHWALESGSLREARDYWNQTQACMDCIAHPNQNFSDSVQAVYAEIFVEEGRYDEGLKAAAQIASSLYQRQITSLLFQTNVFLKAGDKNSADSHLRQASALITSNQADFFRKEADGLTVQLERMTRT